MSIVIIFLLLYHEFRSVKESGVILLNLPLALIGGVFALVITCLLYTSMISIDGLAVEFSGTTLFSDISFVINEKDRIALCLLYTSRCV